MKSNRLLSVFIGLLVFLILTSLASTTDSNEMPVGTVIYSLFPPDVFIPENGKNEWMLLGGQPIDTATSLYATLKKYRMQGILKDNKLPNAKGQFIRSMNHQGGLDPSTNRIVGEPQDDWTREPRTNPFRAKGLGNIGTIQATDKRGVAFHWGGYTSIGLKSKKYLKLQNLVSWDETADNLEDSGILRTAKRALRNKYSQRDRFNIIREHSTKISTLREEAQVHDNIQGGDDETRPKNIALFTYIKIN